LANERHASKTANLADLTEQDAQLRALGSKPTCGRSFDGLWLGCD
jgi:hypothetical protein